MRKTQYGPFYTPQTHTHACTHTHRHAHGPPRICPPPLTATRPLDAQTQVPSINPDSLILLIHPLANTLAPFSKHAQHPTTAEHLPCPRPGPATPPVHTPCNSPGDVARLLPAPRSAPNTAPRITLSKFKSDHVTPSAENQPESPRFTEACKVSPHNGP